MSDVDARYQSAQEHLDDHAVRLLLHLKYYMLRYWHRLTDASGSLSDIYVSLNEALITLTGVPPSNRLPEDLRRAAAPEGLDLLRHEIASFTGHIERRLVASPQSSRFPVEVLRRVFRLEPVELDVVLALYRIQSNLELCRLCTFAWADFTRKQPDVAFLIDLLSGPRGEPGPVARALSPGARLIHNRLVLLHDARDWHPETPHFFQRVLLPGRLVRFLLEQGIDEGFDPALCELRGGERALADLQLDERSKQDAVAAWIRAHARGRRGLIAFYGPAGVGKRSLAAALLDHGAISEGEPRAGDRPRRLLIIRVDPLFAAEATEMEVRLSEALRDARLLDATPLLAMDRGWSPREDPQQRLRMTCLSRALSAYGGVVFVTASHPQHWISEFDEVHEVHIPYTSAEHQHQTWYDALTSCAESQRRLAADYLANQFNLTAGIIYQAAQAASSGTFDEHAIAVTVRKQVQHRLGSLSTPVYTTLGWEDLILPDETMEALYEIQHTMRHQLQVYQDWGFRKVAGGRRGLAALFSGPPGTGKTLAACVLGKVLSRDVYRIDLSQVVDKYIGETEKNLSRLFDESEHAQVLLLFDEADSLFAKRTEVKTSHDRYANLEVNFLLQRIESYEGVSILTTNNESSIDTAFKRRLRFRVNFPQPDVDTRELMWRSMIPKEALLHDGIDWTELAVNFNFSGGHIRNALLRAAFLAADDQQPIGHGHLFRAAVQEAKELGYLVRENET
jgi:DNA replication protein DnaC